MTSQMREGRVHHNHLSFEFEILCLLSPHLFTVDRDCIRKSQPGKVQRISKPEVVMPKWDIYNPRLREHHGSRRAGKQGCKNHQAEGLLRNTVFWMG